MMEQMDRRDPRVDRPENEPRGPAGARRTAERSEPSKRRWRSSRLAAVAAVLALTGAACSDDTTQETESEVEVPVEPARGAADSVDTGSEGGKDLTENLNVPGTDAADDIDE